MAATSHIYAGAARSMDGTFGGVFRQAVGEVLCSGSPVTFDERHHRNRRLVRQREGEGLTVRISFPPALSPQRTMDAGLVTSPKPSRRL